MTSVKFRVLTLIFLCYLPALLILAFILLNGHEFFELFGIAEYDGLVLSIFVSSPVVFAFVIAWQRFVLKVSCPPLNQAFLRQRNATKPWEMKAMITLYLLAALSMYFNYRNSLSSLVSICFTLISLYVAVVVFEVMFHMAKDERVWHPLRQDHKTIERACDQS